MRSKQHSDALPIILLLVGASFWGVLWYPLRLLEANGLSGLWSTLIIYGTALLVGLPVLWRRRHGLHDPLHLLVLAAASGWCNVAFILAVLEGNVVRVMLLFYLSPLWTVLLGFFLLKEPMSAASRITLACAMLGALVMLWDAELGFPWPREGADWLAISSGFAFALNNVMVRRIQRTSIWAKSVVAWLGVVILAGVLIGAGGAAWPSVSAATFTGAVVLGGLGMVSMTIAVIYGITHMPVHRSAILLLFELVAAAISAQWLTEEVVLIQEWSGGVLIMIAGWYAARSHAREARTTG